MRKIILFFVTMLLFLTMGCDLVETDGSNSQSESLVGHIVIESYTLYFDEVEIVKAEDKERLKELGIKDSEMVTPYIIINETQEEETFKLTNETEYTFTDFDKKPDPEKDADTSRLYTTTSKDKFLEHLGDLNHIPLSEQTIVYFIEVKNGEVISIEEKLEYTI